jgi:hypothetical protein
LLDKVKEIIDRQRAGIGSRSTQLQLTWIRSTCRRDRRTAMTAVRAAAARYPGFLIRWDDGSGDGSRMFFERVITALRMMKDLLEKNNQLSYVIEQIASKYKAMTTPVIVGDGYRSYENTRHRQRI